MQDNDAPFYSLAAMRDLNDLLYFAAVVDHGGFTAASRVLGLPKSKLSRRVAQLEERLNVRLLQRSTRRLAVTPIGQSFYTHCKAMLVEADAAETVAAATHAEPCGTLHVACPVALLHMQAGQMLTGFAQQYPLVTLHISALNRAVDVVAEGVDVALRVRPLPLEDSELALRMLGTSPQALVASPALVQRMGTPRTPQDLAQWPSLATGTPTERHAWSLVDAQGHHISVAHTPRLVTSDMFTLREAALAGIGVVQLPHALVQEAIAQGRLQAVLRACAPAPESIHAVFASRRGMVTSVRALLDYLAAQFAAAPGWGSSAG